MNKQKLTISGVFIIIVVSLGVIISLDSPSENYVYTESDITKANPNISISPSAYSLATYEISETKDTVVLTISGNIISVGDPILWIDQAKNHLGYIPVTVEIDRNTKNTSENLLLNKGDKFTVYIGGDYAGGMFFMPDIEPQFEIGEKVILHVGHTKNGPVFEDDGIYFVELGKYGKYKVVDDKAYNEKHLDGKPLDKAFNEAN